MLLIPENSIGYDAKEGSEGSPAKVRAEAVALCVGRERCRAGARGRLEQALSWYEREPGAVRSHLKLERWDATGIEHQGALTW
jgi:hypothetical protein